MIEIVWFKRDLRVHDHAPLLVATQTGNPVVPLYIFETELWSQPELSGRHFHFLTECLAELEAALIARGAGLITRTGDAVDTFKRLHRTHGIGAIHAHEETGLMWTYQRDKAVRAWAKSAGVPVIEHRQHGVWRGPMQRNGWSTRWDNMMAQPPVLAPSWIQFGSVESDKLPSAEELGLLPDPCPQRQIGGRTAGIQALDGFLQTRGRFYRKAMSSPVEGALACSRISPHLAFGTLSMREALHAGQRALLFHRENGDGNFVASVRSFLARLHWHCHFIQKLEDQPEIEYENFHPSYNNLRPITPDHQRHARAWIEGRTGFPFVDACMRSLAATGWLNFRMRAMVMSFSSYHLWQDWRLPAQFLARQFTDFEPGIHYSQAQMQSGTTGINTARIYNPIKQSLDQDPNGDFIKTWVPEIAHLPQALIHEPWNASSDLLVGLNSGGDHVGSYPEPIVDHHLAGAYARSQIYSVRAAPGHKPISDAVQNRHGSRKSGIVQVARIRTKKTTKVIAPTQRSFEF